MSSKIKVFLLCVIAVVSSIVIYNVFGNEKKEEINITEDEKKFKEEYEALNNTKDSRGKEYLSIDIDENNGVIYASFEELKELLTKGTGVVYFGYPECPWCRTAVPMLLQAASNTGLEEIYYFNAKDIRDVKELDKTGKVVTKKEGTKEYYELLEILGDHFWAYDGLEDESIKRLYFPTVVFVLEGEVVGIHIDTIESQKDPRVPLTEKQKNELINIYVNNINKLSDDICDDKC